MPARRVEPALGSDEIWRVSQSGKRGGLDPRNARAGRNGRRHRLGGGLPDREARARAQRGEAVLDRARVLERPGGVDEDRGKAGVAGQRLLEADIEVEGHHHRGGQHHHGQRALDHAPASHSPDPADHGTAAQAIEQHHSAEASGVSERDEHDPGRGAARGADRGDGREDRARTRGADEAERRADPETGPEAATARARTEPGRVSTAGPRCGPPRRRTASPRRSPRARRLPRHARRRSPVRRL